MEWKFWHNPLCRLLYGLPLLLVALFLGGCSADEYLGEVKPDAVGPVISLDGGMGKATRATVPLSSLISDFKLYAVKQTSAVPVAYSDVFQNYRLWHVDNTAGSTATNTSDWEYVGGEQSIKYWDHGAQRYVFWAVGTADRLDPGFTAAGSTYSATIGTLKEDDPTLLYYTEPKVVGSSQYGSTVYLEFKRFVSRIRFGFFETIPGYAVKDVKFYAPGASTGDADCTIGGEYFSQATNMAVSCDPTATTPSLTISYAAGTNAPTSVPSHTFGALNYIEANDNLLTGSEKEYLGKMSSYATYAGTSDGYYTNILPNPDNTTALTLKVDYTLLSTDGSGQTIDVKGATATVPAHFCQWKPNYSYTYLFKISDNTNGSTGGDVVGLYPITFNAFAEIPGTDNNQIGAVTTFGEDWSITTHQKNDVVNDGIIFYKGKLTDVSVIYSDATPPAKNQKIALDGTNHWVVIYHQETNNEWEVEAANPTDRTPVAGAYLETIDKYENGIAYFTPDMPGTYRIEYWSINAESQPEQFALKIMKVEDRTGFNIHYVLNGHGYPVADDVDVMNIPNPLRMTDDADPTWYLVGWFYDEELTNEAVPDTPLVDDIVLYAKWLRKFTGEDLKDTNMLP